jgi:hypothetical protein
MCGVPLRLAGEAGYQASLKQAGGVTALVGPGSVRVGLMDALHTLDEVSVTNGIRIQAHSE